MFAVFVNILCDMIASLHDENNHITVEGFYDAVAIVSDEERKEMNKAPFEELSIINKKKSELNYKS